MNGHIFLALIILAALVRAGVSALRAGSGERRSRRILRVIAVLFMVYGGLGFLAQWLSAAGGLSFLPSWFEWPLGSVSGVVRDKSGRYIAPHTHTGRIQVYDRDKKFVRGWTIDAGGGTFKLHMTEDDLIEVFTARGDRHYVFRHDGTLVRDGTYSPRSYSDLAPESQLTVRFNTPFILLPFSHPVAGWELGVLGVIGLIVLRLTKKKKDRTATESNATSG